MKSIKKNFIFNILLNISNIIFPLVTAPYIARVLDPESIGLANFASTYAGYFAMFAVLGIPTYGVRAIAGVRENKRETEKVVSSLFSLSLLSTIAVTLLYVISIFTIDSLRSDLIIFVVAGVAIYLAPIKINWYYQGIEDFSFITIRSVFVRTISLIALFVFVHDRDDLLNYVLINVLGGVIGDLWNYYRLTRSGIRLKFTSKGLTLHLKPIMTLFVSTIAISIYTVLDTIMLGFMSTYSEVGYYSNAMHLSKAVLALVTSLSVVVVPRVSNLYANNQKKEINALVNKAVNAVSFIAFPCMMGLICVAPTLVPAFLGDKFYGSIIPLQILSVLIIAIGLNNLLGFQCLIALGKDKLFLYVVLLGSFSNLLLNIVLIPRFGSIGASFSSIVAELSILFTEIYLVYRYTFIRFSKIKDVILSCVFSFAFIPISWGVSLIVSGWYFVIISAFSCAIFYIIIQSFANNLTMNEIKVIIFSRFTTKQ